MPLVTDPIGTFPWPAGEQGLENLSAHFPMELADAIDLPAAADREKSHIEGFRIVFRILLSMASRSSTEMASSSAA